MPVYATIISCIFMHLGIEFRHGKARQTPPQVPVEAEGFHMAGTCRTVGRAPRPVLKRYQVEQIEEVLRGEGLI